MLDSIFREYDIRGIVGSELIIDQVYDLARAIAYYFVNNNPNVRHVVVGMDGRTHSPEIAQQVQKALSDSGMKVSFLGVCPSPVVYFALHTMSNADAGIIITASHNGPEDNGFKILLGTQAVWGKEIAHIRDLYKEKKQVTVAESGTCTTIDGITPYIAWFTDNFKHLVGAPISAVIDCGSGATGAVMPRLIAAMQWNNVHLLHDKVDGTYPHHEADPTKEKNMADVKAYLQQHDVAVGIGFDGDGDRMGAMTKEGFLVSGDQLLVLFADQVRKNHSHFTVVADVKCSSALQELLAQWNLSCAMSPCGCSWIKKTMKETSALLGGELSCHFFFADKHFGFDDGIYAAFRLIELLYQTQQPLADLLKIIPKKYSSIEYRIFCPDDKKLAIVDVVQKYFAQQPDVKLITLDGVRVQLRGGWGIVRASNTQPALSMRFESDTQDGLHEIIQQFCTVLAPHVDATSLQEICSGANA